MSSEDEKAAIEARLHESIKRNGPEWQDASLNSFLLKAGDSPAPEYDITVEREAPGEPATTPPVIYLPGAVTSEADTAADPGTKAAGGAGSAATLSGYIYTSEKSVSLHEAGAIGRSIETGELLSITDNARRSGLYVLGRSGSGKTELLKRMILSDIDRGRGVFFVDPHGDAIDDLITRLPAERLADVVCIDPDHETHSFGINLLSCADIRSWKEREATYNRAKAVFDKLWKNMPEELPWLQLIIEHTLPVFIYNPDYTLAETPRFYRDSNFRRSLLQNVTNDPEIVDFWQSYFHQKQADAAMTRVWTLLGRPPVKDIVSQQKSTVDFAGIMEKRRVLFVKLSANLSVDTKKFIGTILISELLHAVRKRGEIPERERHQFCIFVDEFQHFTASEDFATLINEARKFGIATTVAHQERFGQFADDRKLLGATDAAGNKLFFQLGGKDAEEQALEFAVKPPTEARREEQYALSQNPVSDLLARGHIDPDIRLFVTKYLRRLDDRQDDIKADMEGVKFARMIALDTAAIFGAEAQGEGIAGPTHYGAQAQAVSERQAALVLARMHSINLVALHGQGNLLRVTMRGLNRFLTAVMEGEKHAEQEAFADFLISLAAGYSAFPEEYAGVLGLYIKCTYGDKTAPRVIPFELGSKVAHFWAETRRLTNEAARQQAEERSASEREYKEREWDHFYSARQSARKKREVMKYVVAKAMTHKDPYGFLRHCWNDDYGRGFAQAIAERGGGYGSSIGSEYYNNYYHGRWYTIDHFSPQMDYPNSCAGDFSPVEQDKEPLDCLRESNNARFHMESANMRKDVAERKKVLQERWWEFSVERPAAARTWTALDKVGRWYLLMRACDWVMYGKEFADQSFPDPSNSDLRWVVSSLVWLFEEHEAELVKDLEDAEETEERETIERQCARSVAKIVISPPEHLTPRVLGAAEREAVKNACIKEILEGPQVVQEVAKTIDEFARFCVLLAKPENHIKVRTGQYIERQVNARSEIDMVNEKARELVELPIFMAYARVRQETGGEQGLFKGKIRTLQLPLMSVDAAQLAFARNRQVVEENSRRYLKPREQIRAEIEQRQERWRGRYSDQPPGVRGEEKRGPARSSEALPGTEPDEPPPGTQYKSGRGPDKTPAR